MAHDPTELTERIALAEGWLARARRHVEDGHPERGVLTLLLAEAEVHRAREVSATTPRSRRDARAWPRWAAAGLVLASAAAAAFLMLLRAAGPVVEAYDASAPPIVVLPAGTGTMLRLVSVPPPAGERAVVMPTIVRVPVSVAVAGKPSGAPEAVAAPPAAPHASAAPAARPPAASAPPAPAAAPPPALLSEADMIELVLAAERSLRRSGNQ